MGYFAAGFVFASRPDWSALARVAPSLTLDGVGHKRHPLWLLACSDGDRDDQRARFPFGRFLDEPLALDEPTPLVAALSLAAGAVSDDRGADAVLRPALALGIALQRALAQPVFFFAADDEGLNVAAAFDDAGIAECLVDGTLGTARLEDGRVAVAPLVIEGEEEDNPAEFIAEELEGQSLIDVAPLRVIDEDERGRTMFGAALDLWPAGWADPTASLGLGTWDVLANWPADFDAEYSRPAA